MFISEHYGAPVMLMALLLGIAFHFLWEDGPCSPGVDFAATTLLRLGVGLLGVRITFSQIAEIGFDPLVLVFICVPATIGCGIATARIFGKDLSFGIIAGGAVAICGASAALAISAVLPDNGHKDKDTLFTVIAVTALSTLAMVLYPVLFAGLGFSETDIGIILGATIHDVAQVVGAGYAISEGTGDVATFVKLIRVSLLPVVLFAIVIALSKRGGTQGVQSLPWFVVLFCVLAVSGNLGMIPSGVAELTETISRWLLVVAIAALGVRSSLKQMFSLGGAHLVVVTVPTLVLVLMALGITAV